MRLLSVLVVAVTSLAVPGNADACSGLPCWAGYIAPRDGAVVPANLPALLWRPIGRVDRVPADVHMVTLATTANPTVALGFTATAQSNGDYLLVPTQPLVAGTSYIVTDRSACMGIDGPSVVFHAGPAAPLPTALGALRTTLRGVGMLQVSSRGGSCWSDIDAAQAVVELDAAPEAVAWLDALQFQTVVDGRSWTPQPSSVDHQAPGTSWRGRAIDLVYRTCQSDDANALVGLDGAPHVVAMRATLPGTSQVLVTSAVDIALSCPGDVMLDACSANDSCERSQRDGCSAGGSPAPWLIAAVGGFGAVVRRRRRAAGW